MTRKKSQIRHDYKTPLVTPDTPRRVSRLPFAVGAAVVAVAVAAVLALTGGSDEQDATTAAEGGTETLALAMPPVAEPRVDAVEVPADAPSDDGFVRGIPLALPGQPAPRASEPAARPRQPDATTERAAPPADVVAAPRPAAEQAAAAPPDDTPAVVDASARTARPPVELLVRRGDTLDGLFGKNGLSRADLVTLMKTPGTSDHLALLKPGDQVFVTHDDGRVQALTRAIDEERTLVVVRTGDGFDSRIDLNPVERRITHAEGTIDSSLFLAARDAGVSDKLIMNLAGIFAWDIDFVLDIRQGDAFVVVYEEIWQDGQRLRDGDVLAAEFSNRGEVYRAVRFVDDDDNVGHYTPEGINMRKAFIRAPIAITPRVTSNFNPRRLHPVHKKVRPHRGVDYGAPTGTPIKAAGDGKVIFRGRKGGYGNTVILQHGGNITTLYAHMSKFNRKAKMGSRVKQGQVIGYVGATGTATAAHLHYEYRVNGVHQNPRTVKLPKADPIPSRYREAFLASVEPLISRLDAVSRRTRLADAGG